MNSPSRNILLLFGGALAVTLSACGGGGGGGGGGGDGGGPTIKPRYAYVANHNDNSISSYVVDGTSGRLKWIGRVASGTNPESVTVDPSGKYSYVANNSSGNVSQYTIGSDGSLTPMGPATVTAGAGPSAVTVDPSGKYAYVANTSDSDLSAYTIDPTTGALAQIDCGGGAACDISNTVNFVAGTNPVSITVHPSGKYAYATNRGGNNVSQYTIGVGGSLTPMAQATVNTGTNPVSVTVAPSGKNAYVANNGSGDVSAYTIDAGTGALTQIDCGGGAGCKVKDFLAGTNPSSVTVDPSGKFAYVANNADNNVSQYTIGADGSLTLMNTPTVGADTGPSFVTVDPSAKYVFVANSGSHDVSQYTIGSDGRLTALTPAAAPAYDGPLSIALTDGTASVRAVPKFAYAANYDSNDVSGYTIDPGTGMLTQIDCGGGAGCNVKNFQAGTNPYSVAADPTGQYAYVANYFTNDVSAYTIDPSTGALSQIDCGGGAGCNVKNFQAGTNPYSVAVEPLGRYLYVANYGSNDVSAYTIDPSTGALSQIDCGGGAGCNVKNFQAGTNPYSFAVDPSDRFAFVANIGGGDVSAYTIDPTTGALSQIDCGGGTGCNVKNFQAGTNPVSVTVAPSGKYAYVANNGSGDVSAYTIDAVTGGLTAIDADSGTGGIQNFPAGTNPISVAVDPFGKFVYVANFTDNNVSQYTIGTDGSLAPIGVGTVSAGTNPNSVTVDPSGKYAYVANKGDGNVSQYAVGSSGGLSPRNPATILAGTTPSSIITVGTWQ